MNGLPVTIADFIELRRANANALESAAGGKPNQFQRELIADLRDEADRLEAAWKLEFGNMHNMRNALKEMVDWAKAALGHHSDVYITDALEQIEGFGEDALDTQPRNCDVGTVDEQIDRHEKYCASCLDYGNNPHSCGQLSCSECALRWAQMEYKEETATLTPA